MCNEGVYTYIQQGFSCSNKLEDEIIKISTGKLWSVMFFVVQTRYIYQSLKVVHFKGSKSRILSQSIVFLTARLTNKISTLITID